MLKEQGLDTENMSVDEAIAKYNKLNGNRQNQTDFFTGEQQGEPDEDFFTDKDDLTQDKDGGKLQVPNATEFNRLKTKQHLSHAKDMGFKNQKEYEKAAVEFFNGNEGKRYFGKARGEYCRYDDKTGRYAVCSNDGRIKTYFSISKKSFKRIEHQEDLIDG